jgi:hypothetical protein
LEKYLKEAPQLYQIVFDISKIVQQKLVETIIHQRPGQMSLKANIIHLRDGMAYEKSPVLEQLLIENVINCWLRLEWIELQLTGQSNQEYINIKTIEYWEKRLSANQRRYLRAVETLARVRKLTRNTPMLQVNIATQDGQQVNIAGDVVKADKSDQ